jgi:glutaredoxin-related protein
MTRALLDEVQVHPAIRNQIGAGHRAVVDEVRAAIAQHPIVVVGMAVNPWCGRARKALAGAGVDHHYLEYGSYLRDWRTRLALKMWTGWPTFPMVFVRGQLVGGAQDLEKLIASGELPRLLAA